MSPGSLDLPTELALSPGSQLHSGTAVSSVRLGLGPEVFLWVYIRVLPRPGVATTSEDNLPFRPKP